ncbi:ABC transporter ATP-binding protein [Paenibacillus abyssi]|uniref:Peptide ABC transporter ATP-binding protein n=1 Tax=Paenibacillus abyssi TaxID=1340531 RepID=A0A917LDQ8_9BACL|nr:ABC transporter ATP-binding protein [Paenibacillus abyssi]GGG15020.1 peptide ABC transporter ATP-binding protein [Paenibacillus abyssi]
MQKECLLEVSGLKTTFLTENGPVTVVNGVSFQVSAGETLGVVGESGCGKSVTSESILRLLNEKTTRYEGEINYKNRNLLSLTEEEMRSIRGNEISMIFQDPMTSLNPVYTIGDQIAETIMIHQKVGKKAAFAKAVEMLRLTGIPSPEKRVHEYPHELSGGMRQRVMIAIALACQPKLLVADEPTTALDVTIQTQILDLIQDLKQQLDMGVILITHDLGVVAEVCTRVVVMYLGEVVEEAGVEELFENPLHPYTQGLLQSVPQLDGDRSKKLYVIKGAVPSLTNVPKGCRFAPRCNYATDLCRQSEPELMGNRHKVRCWHADTNLQKEGELYVADGS